MKVLLSIKPEYAEKIFSGEKRFEFRKTCFKRPVTTVIVYATMPVGKIVGEFEIEDIFSEDPEMLWDRTKLYAGISYSFFSQYFMGKKVGHAIQVKSFTRYLEPQDPHTMMPQFIAPQSFKYL